MRNLILFLFLPLLFGACTDNSTDSSVPRNANEFFPMKIGNYWIYEFEELDTLSNPIGTKFIDSTVITGKMDMLGVMLYEFSTYRSGELIRTEHWAADNTHIWQLRGAQEDSIPGIQDTLFRIVKFNALDWNVYFFHSDSIDYVWDGLSGWADYIFNANSRLDFTSTDVYNYKSYESRSYKFTADKIFGFITKDNPSGILISNFAVCYYTFAKGIGPTEIKKLSSFYHVNYSDKFWVNGFRKRLIRHKIL